MGEWEAKRLDRTSARDKDVDAGSTCSSEMVSTAASLAPVVDAQEVERVAMLDRQVRKLAKVLREIEALEVRGNLNALQEAKIARKVEVEIDLEMAKSAARAVAREQLRRQ